MALLVDHSIAEAVLRSLRLVLFLFACATFPAASFAQSATRTIVGASPNPSVAGQSVTIVADVDAAGGGVATGAVTFKDGPTTLGAATLSAVGANQSMLEAGGGRSCAVSVGGSLKCWGFNGFGELGDGTTTPRSTPVGVSGLSNSVVAVAAGDAHSCAVSGAAGLLCWGYNNLGALGDGTTATRLLPTRVSGFAIGDVAAVAAGAYHSCAATRAGAAFCWGANGVGQIGDGTTTGRLTRTAVSGLSSGVRAVAAGGLHSCALTTAGAVKCWGSNGFAQLGDGTATSRSRPVSVLGLSSGVVAISTSGHATCAILAGGGLRCWGRNWYGGLGDGTTFNRNRPVAVAGLAGPVISVAVGIDHSCAVSVAGAVQCWGRNNLGQLGDGSIVDRTRPVAVVGLSSGAVAVAVGEYHSCALLRTGGVRCWGYNAAGQLGDGTTTSRLTPVATRSLTALLRARAQISTTRLGVGGHALKAIYPGDANHAGSAGNVSHRVN
ncbi:MAG TPA: chromosome condensation regulator RCC1 [Methylosinus sp.]